MDFVLHIWSIIVQADPATKQIVKDVIIFNSIGLTSAATFIGIWIIKHEKVEETTWENDQFNNEDK